MFMDNIGLKFLHFFYSVQNWLWYQGLTGLMKCARKCFFFLYFLKDSEESCDGSTRLALEDSQPCDFGHLSSLGFYFLIREVELMLPIERGCGEE